jgi:hypothetical protein
VVPVRGGDFELRHRQDMLQRWRRNMLVDRLKLKKEEKEK